MMETKTYFPAIFLSQNLQNKCICKSTSNFLTTVFICQKPLKHWSWSWRERGRERERERENCYLLGASGGWSVPVSSTLSLPIIPWVHCSLLSSCIVLSETPVWQKKQTIQIVMHTFYVCTFKSYFISQMHFIQTLKQLHCIYTLYSIQKFLPHTWKNFQQRLSMSSLQYINLSTCTVQMTVPCIEMHSASVFSNSIMWDMSRRRVPLWWTEQVFILKSFLLANTSPFLLEWEI